MVDAGMMEDTVGSTDRHSARVLPCSTSWCQREENTRQVMRGEALTALITCVNVPVAGSTVTASPPTMPTPSLMARPNHVSDGPCSTMSRLPPLGHVAGCTRHETAMRSPSGMRGKNGRPLHADSAVAASEATDTTLTAELNSIPAGSCRAKPAAARAAYSAVDASRACESNSSVRGTTPTAGIADTELERWTRRVILRDAGASLYTVTVRRRRRRSSSSSSSEFCGDREELRDADTTSIALAELDRVADAEGELDIEVVADTDVDGVAELPLDADVEMDGVAEWSVVADLDAVRDPVGVRVGDTVIAAPATVEARALEATATLPDVCGRATDTTLKSAASSARRAAEPSAPGSYP